MRICIFDIETRKDPSELGPGDIGWDLLKQGKGGMSAICIYDTVTNWPHVYDDFTIETIATHLEAADIIVGYSSEQFDLPVIEGIAKRKLNIKHHYDIYEAIKKATARLGHIPRKGEYKLGVVCERTIGEKKIDSGEHAPQLSREGRFGQLFRYCMHDVWLTKKLLEHILNEGGIVGAHGTFLPLEIPECFKAQKTLS